jgi:hypothetical protein
MRFEGIALALSIYIFSCTTGKQSEKTISTGDQSGKQFGIMELTDTSRLETIYTFPILVSHGNDSAVARINRTLQQAELELEVGTQDSSIFEKIWPAEDSFSGITEFGYRIIENSSKIFSIEFNKEGCGAYCEGFSSYYSFDANTGALLKLDQILTETGFHQLRKEVIEERRTLIQQSIEQADSTEEGMEMKEMYTQCLDYITELSFNPLAFYVDNGKIVLLGSRCSSHAQLAIDEIGEFENTRSTEQISGYLNSYGKSLLAN